MKAWRLDDLEGPQKGLLRIPDVTILKTTGAELAAMRSSGAIDWPRLIPFTRNIEMLCEIKFPGDQPSRRQLDAYSLISNVALLTVADCGCNNRRQRVPVQAPVRVPVKAPTPDQLAAVIPLPWPMARPTPRPAPVTWGNDPIGAPPPTPDPVPGPAGWNLPTPDHHPAPPPGSTAFRDYVDRSIVVGEVILVGALVVVAVMTVEVWGPVVAAALFVTAASEALADDKEPKDRE